MNLKSVKVQLSIFLIIFAISLSLIIKKVSVSLDGKEIIQHMVSRQDNNTEQIVTYLVPDAKEGDVLGIEAYRDYKNRLHRLKINLCNLNCTFYEQKSV